MADSEKPNISVTCRWSAWPWSFATAWSIVKVA
jgi:hypothetical protein